MSRIVPIIRSIIQARIRNVIGGRPNEETVTLSIGAFTLSIGADDLTVG